MAASSAIGIQQVNTISVPEFQKLFSNVIELWPRAAVEVVKHRPFVDRDALVQAFHQHLDDIDESDKVTILTLHPDLAGRLAAQGQLTAESAHEQASAGLTDMTDEQRKEMDMNNDRYKTKFGFPFIICARENKVQSILCGLRERYHNTREQEINTAINEVKKICKLRILDIVL